MDEPTAWLDQAKADRQAAEHLLAGPAGLGQCHAVAKWQQAVEKSVKAIVLALRDKGLLNTGIRPRHEVEPYVALLIRLPRTAPWDVQSRLRKLLNQNTRAGITALDALAPQRVSRRNTEYPFQDASGRWTYPAASGVFSQAEVGRFRKIAYDVLDGAGHAASAIRRLPG